MTGGAARAEDARTSSLSWLRMPGADSCIATQALARSVEDRLGRHVFVSAAEADVSVEGRIEKKKGAAPGWHAVLTIRDAKGALLGTRDLDRPDASCASMNEGLTIVIAVMIDPDAKLGKAEPAPLPAAPPPKQAEPAPLAAPAPTLPPPHEEPPPAPPRKEPLRVEGDVGAVVSDGLAPSVAPGVQVAGMLWLPGIPVGARGYGALFLPTNAEQGGARGSFDMVYVGSALCPTFRASTLVGMACIGGQLGALRSHAETPDRSIDEKTMLLWNLVAEMRFTIPIHAPVGLTAGAGGVIPILRPTFLYTSSDAGHERENLHKVSLGGIVTDLGIAFFFP